MASRSLSLTRSLQYISDKTCPLLSAQTVHKCNYSQHAKIGPAVRSTLDIYSLDSSVIIATGPQGTILKGDLLKYIQEKGLKPAPVKPVVLPSGMAIPSAEPVKQKSKPEKSTPHVPGRDPKSKFSDQQLSNMRRTIAKRLTESKTTIPHTYATMDCKMDNVNNLRKQLKEDGVSVSVNDFIIKAAGIALKQVPEANVVWSGETAVAANNIDISVAVATDTGLITPIINNVAGIGIEQISQKVRDLAARAKEGKLKPEEYLGGTFTISNLGMFGIAEFSAVINPPQACILAVGASRLVLNNSGNPQSVCTVTLSTDARIVPEDVASKFLEAYKYIVENPMTMLTHVISTQSIFDS